MKREQVQVRLDNQVYKAEMPIVEGFTGQIGLVFNWKHGKLMKAEVHKNNSVVVLDNVLSTEIALHEEEIM